jgi:hypothetical protein
VSRLIPWRHNCTQNTFFFPFSLVHQFIYAVAVVGKERVSFFYFYLFVLLYQKYADCGSNLSVPGAASGVFTSPKYPEKYDRSSGLLSCSWQIHSARDHRILLHFESFSIEGEMESKFPKLIFRFIFLNLLLIFGFSQLGDVRRLPSAFGEDWTNRL